MEAYNWIFFASRLANSQAGKNDVFAQLFSLRLVHKG